MKQWIILGIVGVVGYGAYKWYQQNKSPYTPIASNIYDTAHAAAGNTYGPLPNPSGVPQFNATPVSGDPQDIAAALHTNPMATTSGSMVYTPAFGPQMNQPTADEVTTW